MKKAGTHSERAHSRFAASSAERWMQCPYSVAASERARPIPDGPWAAEGTLAHEKLEAMVKDPNWAYKTFNDEMTSYVLKARQELSVFQEEAFLHKFMVEEKVYLDFIHEDMYGTLDYGIIEPGAELHILDFKYGKKRVSPVESLQLIFYALGIAHKYHYDFASVKLTIIQPRCPGKISSSWETSVKRLKDFEVFFRKGVARVERGGNKPVEGSWCFFCKARLECPAKLAKQKDKSRMMFSKWTD